MRICFLLATLAAMLPAQAPTPPGGISPDTVVATIDGKDVTAGELRKLLEILPPQQLQQLQQNPIGGLTNVWVIRYLAGEAEKLKLDEKSPVKEQLEFMRQQILTQAFVINQGNSIPVSADEIEAFYSRNQLRYEQAKVKVIKIAFKPAIASTGTSPDDVKRAAEEAFNIAHAATDRPEADAKTIATNLVKKLRAGADFARLVADFSEDVDSKSSGGDFGIVKPTSPYPDAMKKAIFALKPGEVSDPIPQPNAFYIFRVEEKSAQPLAEVNSTIIQEVRNAKIGEFVNEVTKRFTPTITKPEFFLPGAGMAGKKP